MPTQNADIARMLSQIADFLEIQGANPFRVRAYRNAARTVSGFPRRVTQMLEDGADLTDYDGIGEDLAGKITDIAQSGRSKQLEILKKRHPEELLKILEIPGLGAKRVRRLYRELKIKSRSDLAEAAENHEIQEMKGFGATLEENILDALSRMSNGETRMKIAEASEYADSLIEYLKESDAADRLTVAGSFRRRKETVGDLDILAVSRDRTELIRHFTGYEDVKEVVSRGKTRSTVILQSNLQVDLRVVDAGSYGAALLYFTGSKAHNITLRKWAVSQDITINEYGAFRDDDQIAGKTEEEMYALFDLPWIEPELREDRGELKAAADDALPDLVTLDDIRGDLHVHTRDSDGHLDLQEIADIARKLGYNYIGITDHSPNVAVAGGQSPDTLQKQMDRIDAFQESLDDLHILKGAEVDILKDGSLDYPDDILKHLDYTVCSIHTDMNLPRDTETDRIIRAMDNHHFNILGHPTGRRIGDREPMDIDMEKIMDAAVERGCLLELNAHPDRLDLNDIHCKMAREKGVTVIIATDSHRSGDLKFMRYGVGQARRGWLTAGDIGNTQSLKQLKRLFSR